VAIQGNHSMTPYSQEANRVWRFVAIGEGWDPANGAHDQNWWARFMTELGLWGYDHVMSIEHEDALASMDEGLKAAVDVLSRAILTEPPVEAWWT